MRLFIAINFSDTIRRSLLTLRDGLRDKSTRGNFTAQNNLHLTLAFLGECDVKQTAAIKSAMDEVDFESFAVEIDRIGRFKRKAGDLWWAGVRESKPLMQLQSDLTDKLIAAGFPLETRKYSPHITLGREVVTDEQERHLSPFGDMVTKIDLMKSERIKGKLTYTSIFEKGARGVKL